MVGLYRRHSNNRVSEDIRIKKDYFHPSMSHITKYWVVRGECFSDTYKSKTSSKDFIICTTVLD